MNLELVSQNAEQAVLGAMMLDARAVDDAMDILDTAHFYRSDHRQIFEAIIAISERGGDADVISVVNHLRGKVDVKYIGEIGRNAVAANVKTYATIVRDRAIDRQLLKAASEIQAIVGEVGADTGDKLDRAQVLVQDVAESRARGSLGPQSLKVLLPQVVDDLDQRHLAGGNAVTGIPSGFEDLDKLTTGMHGGDLVIIAGRPSMGKTTFAVNLLERAVVAAVNEARVAAMFSMEMPAKQITERMVASNARVPFQLFRTGNLEDEHWKAITTSMGRLVDAPLFIDQTPALTPREVRSRCRAIRRKHGLDLVVLDYLQLMSAPEAASERRVGEISAITRGLKALAMELDVPVIALSQLNRELERRPNKRPVMADLRESGAIEQDADLILFLYRDEVYNEDSADKGTAEVIIGKQRNGPLGTVRLTYRGELMRFESYVPWAAFQSG